MHFTTAFATLALASAAIAAPQDAAPLRMLGKRAWTNMEATTSGPTGTAGQTFEMTIDNGASWQNNARNMPLGAGSTVGFRRTGDNSTSVIHKNTLPGNPQGSFHWSTTTGGGPPYHYGLYNNDIFLSTDFSKPAHTNVSGQWVPVPMSAEVKVSNDGHCVLSSYNATVHYKSWTGRAPRVVVSQDPMHFQIPDLLVVANITFSFGGVFHSGSKSAFLMQYEDASKGPLTTAHMQIYGGFCDVDD